MSTPAFLTTSVISASPVVMTVQLEAIAFTIGQPNPSAIDGKSNTVVAL